MAAAKDWLRVRGMGRERFAGYIADFLTGAGFTVERSESADPAASRVKAKLARMNPAVPDGAKEIEIVLEPTSGGASCTWVQPVEVPGADRERLDRLIRELVAHVERAVLTESHATAKVTRSPGFHFPWTASP
ncbi:MAG: hypothetical protein ACREDK_04535 [Thermoplasmata archaeon]